MTPDQLLFAACVSVVLAAVAVWRFYAWLDWR